MNRISIKSYAKINLGLDVTGVLPNGYHTVKMIMQTISLNDTLYFEISKKPGIVLKTNMPFLPVNEKNIVYKAIQLFCSELSISCGVYCSIMKHIPVAAGLAGGSGNAAAALIALNTLLNTNLTTEELMKMGVKLGADVPFCILGKTALAEGIGEILTPLPAPPRAKVLIVKPSTSVSTAEIYSKLVLDENTVHPDIDACVRALENGSLTDLCKNMGNILEDVTIELHPMIRKIKEKMLLHGAAGTLMSGSGPTVFGLFENETAAQKACLAFKTDEQYKKSTYLCDFCEFT